MQRQPYEFTKLIQCWQAMPRELDQAPQKTTFSPVKVSSLMPFLFLVEREEKGDLVVRLMGSELEETLGFRSGDRRVFDAMFRQDWSFYDSFVERCATHICGGQLLRSVKLKDGLVRDVESLHVPLADKDGVARFMLGVMTMRTNRDTSVDQVFTSPKSAILNYQYVDLGCGLPPVSEVMAPAQKKIKGTEKVPNSAAAMEPLPISGEYVPAYVN